MLADITVNNVKNRSSLTETDILNEHLTDLSSLVALKLDDLAELFVFNDCAIASELLLEVLEQLLRVVLVGYTLDGSQGLATITLLDTDVDVFGRLGRFLERILSFELIGIGESVCSYSKVSHRAYSHRQS